MKRIDKVMKANRIGIVMAKKSRLLAVVLFFMLLSGCGDVKVPYHAVMYGNLNETGQYLKSDFYESNLTYGSYSTVQEDYIQDENIPISLTKIIKTEDAYDRVFKEFPAEVDFEKSMILMYCFTTVSNNTYDIKHISVVGKNIMIRYTLVKSKKPLPNASVPLTKWLIVILDKLDIETTEFMFVD